MNNLLMIIPGVIFSLQTTVFKLYSKKCDQDSGSNAFFTTIMLAITSILALPFAFSGGFDPQTILYGAILGVCFFAFMRLYNEALANGPMSYTVFIFSMNMILPIVASAFLYGEIPTLIHYVGFVILIVAIAFMNFSSQRTANMVFTKKWFALCIFGLLANSGVALLSKMYPIEVAQTNYPLFMTVAFLIATILSTLMFASKNVRKSLETFSPNKWFFILAVLVGITNLFGNGLMTMLSTMFDASIYFPTLNGASVMLSLIISRVAFKEKLKPSAVVGIFLGLIAVMILSM